MNDRVHIGWAGSLALALGCTPGPELTIVADIATNCSEVDVDIVIPGNGVGISQVLDAAAIPVTADSLGDDFGVWLLVLVDAAQPTVAVRHIVDGQVTREVPLPLYPTAGVEIALHPSPNPDEVWVSAVGNGDFYVWRIDEALADPPYQPSRNLAAFPHDSFTCAPCETSDWYRDLVFLGDDPRPYLVSVPPLSNSSAISVWVGGLSGVPDATGVLDVGTEHRLNFERTCDTDEFGNPLDFCQLGNEYTTYPFVEVLGRQGDPRPGFHRLLVRRVRNDEDLALGITQAMYADIFVVTLDLDAERVPKGVLRSYQGGWQPVPDPPSGLVVDRYSTYVMYTSERPDDATRLLELPAPTADFEDITASVPADLSYGIELLSLDADLALGRLLDDGAWEITKLFPDAFARSKVFVYAPEAPIAQVREIGPGYFLLAHEEGRPDIARVHCVEPTL